MNQFAYGAVLKIQREFTLDEIYAKLKQMKNIGMNTAVIWPAVYWWEDRDSPDYPYNTGKRILEYAHSIDMKIIMELSGQITALEYAPDYLMKDDYYVTNEHGVIKDQNWSYDYLNFNHPEVKELIKKNFTMVATIYRDFPALYGYDIFNETMFSSKDKYTLQFFREWLRNKYSTIKRINEVWDRTYNNWDEIRFTNWMWASVMPVVDYNRFKKENIGMLLREWRSAIKEIDAIHPVIADNIHCMITSEWAYNAPHDDWNVAENVDEYGISFYPKNTPPFMPPYTRCEVFTGAYSASRNGRFWVSELQSHTQALITPHSAVYPHELRWWNWEAISRGAKGIIYWKWDPFIKGQQVFGRGLVDHKGNYTARAREAEIIKKIIDENDTAFRNYTPMKPRAAIVYDKSNHDFIRALTVEYSDYTPESIYTDSIGGLYKCLWEQNIPVKFITTEDIINNNTSGYIMIFITNQIYVSKQLASAILRYVKNGGFIISDGRFALIDENGMLCMNIPGHQLRDELGWELLDVDISDLGINIINDSSQLNGYYEKQIIQTENPSSIIARFTDNNPAIIKTTIGSGSFTHIATFLWYGYYKENDRGTMEFIKTLAEVYKLSCVKVQNEDVKIACLEGDDGILVFAFNYTDNEQYSVIEFDKQMEFESFITDLHNVKKIILDKDSNSFSIRLDEYESCVYRITLVK